ncbi:MAG: hypothetical protein JWQ38_3088 [Flavipsychrobacter sp.]|nr:hypothetical protein [Flavipsychrobacter sp.]
MGSPGLVAIIKSGNGKICFVNGSFEHYLGYNNDDIASADILFTDMLHPYQHERLLNQLVNIKDNIAARSQYLIYPIISKDGITANYYLYASPIEDSSNSAEGQLYYILMFPDLSKWGMPFTSFESKELFLEQFDSEDFGTFERNLDADKVFWSAGLYRIFEVDPAMLEIDTQYAMSFIHPDDLAMAKESAKAAFAHGTDLNIEIRIVTATKRSRIVHCLARLVKNVHGQPRLFTGSVRDVTDQRMIEEDLKNKVEELHLSNRELEEFAYIASHDMQEPLRKITTFSDRLSEKYKDVLTGEGAMYLARMNASAENMRNLINDLLDFSRIAKSVLPYEQVDLNKILQQVLTDLELIIEETGTVIHTVSLPEIDAVPSQMKQLLTNLINNAIKFHKEDIIPEITITVGIATADDLSRSELTLNKAYYKIDIIDNGIGFEDEYANRIFQVFQRLHGKSEYPGSGIGLAICKKILEFHHGDIYAENIPEVGARFTFIIPHNQQTA